MYSNGDGRRSRKRPFFTIAGAPIKWIANKPFKFLGKQICTDGSDEAARKLPLQKFEECVTQIDEAPLTGSQNMWIFDKVLMSKYLGTSSSTTWQSHS